MPGKRIPIENSIVISKGNTISFENIFSERNEKVVFPRKLYDRMMYRNTGNDWGWWPNKADFIFTFRHYDIDDEIIDYVDNFSKCFSIEPFYNLDFIIGGQGLAEIAISWVLEFIANYTMEKMLDKLLLKISGEKNAKIWEKIEKKIGVSGKIIIKLGTDEFGKRTLELQDVPVVLKTLDNNTIEKIITAIRNNPCSFIYNKNGLVENDYIRGYFIDKDV